jgi:diguanylate cyclase (GGDEF)-like protein/PAS domain S-box-containing protein
VRHGEKLEASTLVDRHGLAAENNGLWDWNLKTNRVHFSPRWVSMLGYGEHELGNTPEEWFQRIHPEEIKQVQADIDAHLASRSRNFEIQHRMRHKDGSYRWMSCQGTVTLDKEGEPVRVTGSHSDVTEGKVVDGLTGVPNRLLFLDRLTGSIERAKRHNDFLFAVLLLDLDRFKSLNESLGPAAGDRLLIAAARRLETCLRSGDTVSHLGRDHTLARLGGDEFCILLDGLNEVGEAKTVAERLLKDISAPFELDGHEVFVTASVGIALSVTGYTCSDDALRDADIAMYRAKSLGRARCEVFDTAILKSAQTQLQLESDLQLALERQEFVVFYQPIVSLASRRIAGFEALLRWNHPTRGMVSPLDFIPIAEKTGLIVQIGRWVLREACLRIKSWQETLGIPEDLWVSVNCSSLELRQPSLVEYIGEILHDSGLEPRCLMLELTESVVIENPQAAISRLMQLRVMGVQISLDDFGSGYSSLSYLRQLPVDFVKIDRSFTRLIESSNDVVEIIRSVGGLAHQLGLHVIAEGLENQKQLELSQSLNCDYGQGFLISEAVNGEKAAVLLAADLTPGEWKESEERPHEQAGSIVDEFSDGSPLPVADNPLELPVADQAKPRFRWKAAPLWIAVSALILMLAAGIVTKIVRRMPPPSADLKLDLSSPTETPAEMAMAEMHQTAAEPAPASEPDPIVKGDLAKPVKLPLVQGNGAKPIEAPNASGLLKKNANAAAAPPKVTPAPVPQQDPQPDPRAEHPPVNSVADQSEQPVSASAPSDIPSREAVPDTYPVVHSHLLGSCKGILKLSETGISYIPENGNDGFTFKSHEYLCAIAEDRLVIKSGTKTYRFKSATARTKEENKAELQKILQTVANSRPDTQSKKH